MTTRHLQFQPRSFGRRRPFVDGAVAAPAPAVSDDVKLFAADPITGKPEWGLIAAPGGGVMGVRSLSEAKPVKSGGFAARDITLANAARYADWQFSYAAPSQNGAAGSPPAAPASPSRP